MRTKQVKKLKVTTRDRHLAWINHYVTNDFGIWIECTVCKKWRKNYEYCESHEVPENWICSMGTSDNGEKRRCEDPEENFEEDYFEYCPGSLVWAKLDGYPWWPGMVDEDPDIEEYCWKNKNGSYQYNVTFLDEHVTHAWIPATCISPYLKPPHRNSCLQKQYKHNKYSKAIMKAEEQAEKALKMTIKERLKHFSFVYLYKGKWPLAYNFEEEEDNPLDITDILLQEIDDLDSIDSFETDDQESFTKNLDFLPSEKKMVQNGFDCSKKKNKVKSLKRMENPFKKKSMHRKPNEIGENNILKSKENVQFAQSLVDEESVNMINKKDTISVMKNQTATAKRRQNSNLSNKKLKTENNCPKSKVDMEPPTKSANTTGEKEHELIDISNPDDSEELVFPLNTNKLPDNTLVGNAIEKECIKDDKIISGKNIVSNEINSNTLDLNEINKCSPAPPLKDFCINEITSQQNLRSDPNDCNTPTDETKKEGFKIGVLKLSHSLITEESKNITESIIQPLEVTSTDHTEVGTFASHLDECITNVINNVNVGIESPFLPIPTFKKRITQNGKPKHHILKNTSNDFNPISTGIPKAHKKTTGESVPEVSKQNKCKNDRITPVKKSAKLVGYDKLKLHKNVVGANKNKLENPPSNAVSEYSIINFKKNGDGKKSIEPKKICNITNSHNKMKPDFKSFKRPFKNTNTSLQNNVLNIKQHTQENANKKHNSKANSLILSNTEDTDLILNDEKGFSCISVDDETFTEPIMKRADEISLPVETNLGDSECEPSENKENNFEISFYDDDDNVNKDNKYKDKKKDIDECFFCISDEE